MKITLVMVMSSDGKITAGKNSRVHHWTSKEDQKYFSALVKKSSLVIMGRKTFDAARASMKLSAATLRAVLTKNPARFKKTAVPKQLEFFNASPKTLLKNMARRGYRAALLVGGAKTAAAFFRDGLVDELSLTVEPVLLGRGVNLCDALTPKVCLRLVSVKKLNARGTLLLKYTVGKGYGKKSAHGI